MFYVRGFIAGHAKHLRAIFGPAEFAGRSIGLVACDGRCSSVTVAGPRGSPSAPGRRPPRGPCVSESDEDQHFLVGEDTKTELQTKEVSRQASLRRICK